MPVADVAQETGLSMDDVHADLAAGVEQLREVLGVPAEQIEAWAARERERAAAQADKQAAARSASFDIRHGLCTAIIEGIYPIGATLPSSRVLAAAFAPPRHVPWGDDARLARGVLTRLCRDGVLTRTAAGYAVAAVPAR
jgi:hypothetical protein